MKTSILKCVTILFTISIIVSKILEKAKKKGIQLLEIIKLIT